MSEQITTISFFRFQSLRQRVWAFAMMQFAHAPMTKIEGLNFYKLMGTGKAGFNPWPDWSTYVILQVWDNLACAERYFNKKKLFERYQRNSSEHLIFFLKNTVCRGEWDGHTPFLKHEHLDSNNPYLVVLTRATIRTKLLLRFWKFVPTSQKSLISNPGLLFTKGVGEVPFKQMATFSFWQDVDSLNEFAYRAQGHIEAIKKTRDFNWYSEELFSRFQPFKSFGSWEGANLPQNFSLQ